MDNNPKNILKECQLATILNEIYKQAKKKERVPITLGNTSCDQDSFVGSHVLGIVENRIPVVNMHREIFKYKLDLCYMAELMGLTLDDLIFLEKREEGLALVRGKQVIFLRDIAVDAFLVDFSDPAAELLSSSSFYVERIVDHRSILETDNLCSNVQEVWINLHAGSCCSLLFHYIKTYYSPELDLNTAYYRFIFMLCLPILTDTTFLTERTHKLDISAVDKILAFTGMTMDDASAMHLHVKKLQHCESKAGTQIILQMCHKRHAYPDGSGRYFGISVVKYSYDEWITRDTKDIFLQELKDFLCAKKYEFLIINSLANGVREFFVLQAPGSDFVQKVFYGEKEVQKREINNDADLTVYRTDTFFVGKMIVPGILKYLNDQKDKQ